MVEAKLHIAKPMALAVAEAVVHTQLRLVSNAPRPPDKRDYARVLRSAAARGLCRKTDIYKRSNIKGNNNIPRVM